MEVLVNTMESLAQEFGFSEAAGDEHGVITMEEMLEPKIAHFFHMFNDPLYLLIIPYCVGQPLFRAYCERTNIYETHKKTCKNIMCAYNLILCLFSLWCCLYMLYALIFEIPAGVYGLGHYESEKYGFVSYLFYLSKYVEFLDTYFLILCKRPVIWLQYLHHIGAPLDTGIWHNHSVEGTWIYVVFNGLIHTVMYYYYACCIMRWPFAWKRMITNLQLLQFVSGLCVVLPYIWVEGYWNVPEKKFAFLFNYAYVLMNLFMFINFYRQTYIMKAKAKVVSVKEAVKKEKELEKKAIEEDITQELAAGNLINTEDSADLIAIKKVTDVANKKDTDAAKEKAVKEEETLTIYFMGNKIIVSDEWLRKHPGGTKVLRIFNERDATDAMLAMHSEQAIKQIKAMCTPIDQIDKEKCISQSQQHARMTAINDAMTDYITHQATPYMKLYDIARGKGFFEAEPLHEFFKGFYAFGLFFLGYAFCCPAIDVNAICEKISNKIGINNVIGPVMGSYQFPFGILSMAFGMYLLGWLGHDWSHHTYLPKSNSKWTRMNDWLAWMTTVVRGTSLLSWKLRHNTHHVVTNELNNDPDIRLSPFLMFFEDFDVNTLTGWQHVYMFPFLSILQLFWHYESWEACLKHGELTKLLTGKRGSAKKNAHTRMQARHDVVAMLLHYVLIGTLIYRSGGCVLPFLGMYLLSGWMTGIIVVSSHYAEERLDITDEKTQRMISGYKTEKEHEAMINKKNPMRVSLVHETALTVRNICSFSGKGMEEHYWFWLTGGLNTQIEHHLFPMMPRKNLRKMTPYIREAFAKEGLEFRESTLTQCSGLMFKQLRKNMYRNLVRVGLCKPEENPTMEKETKEETINVSKNPSVEKTNNNAATSYAGSLPLVVKVMVLLFLGGLLTSDVFPSYLTSVFGVFLSCIALTACDCIREDCANGIFFPSRVLNKATSAILNFVLNNWWGILLVGMVTIALNHAITTAESWDDVIYSLNYFAIPCMIMRVHMLVEKKSHDYKARLEPQDRNGNKGSPKMANQKNHGSQTSVDRLLPGLSNRIDEWMRIAEEVTRPTESSTGNLALPFQGRRLSGVPMYAVNNLTKDLDREVNLLANKLQLELELTCEKALSQEAKEFLSDGVTVSGVESMAQATPDTTPTMKKNNSFASPRADEGIQMVEESTSSTNGDSSSTNVIFSIPEFRSEQHEADEPRTMDMTADMIHKPVSAFKSALIATLRFILAPLRMAFRSIFLWKKRDIALYAVVGVYLLMIAVGFNYFSYTPVCILFGLFGPKSKAGKFMRKRWEVLENNLQIANNDITEEESSISRKFSKSKEAEKQVTTWVQQLRKSIIGDYQLNIFMCFYIGIVHLMALHAIVILCFFGGGDYIMSLVGESATPVKTNTLLFAIALWPISGLGITAGAHRLWAHKSYEAHWSLKIVLMLMNSIAHQGSIYHWARDHRTHHLHSDTEKDPHDRNRGFFYAHMGWLLVKKPQAVVDAGRAVDISDLKKDPIVMFQKSVDPWFNFLWCFAIPAFVALFLFDDTLWNGFLYAGVLRYVWVLHCTWAVNSIVHFDYFGNPSPYDESEPPSESGLVSFLAIGEGWHSWHHAYPFDYAAAELGSIEQYNPTKIFIDMCHKFGLIGKRKTGQRMWAEKKKYNLKKKAVELGVPEDQIEIVESLNGIIPWKIREIEYKKIKKSNSDQYYNRECTNSDQYYDNMLLVSDHNNTLSVSSGDYDNIIDIKDWEKATNLTKDNVMNLIPVELKKRVWWKSSLYLLRAIIYCGLCSFGFMYLQNIKIGSFDVGKVLETNSLFNFFFWSVYAIVQGTLGTGIWVIGHECGHGAFSESNWLNDLIGTLTHTPLLVPYFAWQFTHSKHHKFTNHLTKGETHVPSTKPAIFAKLANAARGLFVVEEFVAAPIGIALVLLFGWPLYLVFNLTGGRENWKGDRLNKKKPVSHFFGNDSELFPPIWRKRIHISAICFVVMCGALGVWSNTYGVMHMVKWYFFPYLVINGWLVLYTWLHHTHDEVPHFGDESFNWLRGALCTIDRPYPWIIDHIHLHIGSTHVLHHLNSRIPHYHAKAATKILKDNLGPLYRYDSRGIIEATWNVFKTCHYVESVKGLQFYRQYGGPEFIRQSKVSKNKEQETENDWTFVKDDGKLAKDDEVSIDTISPITELKRLDSDKKCNSVHNCHSNSGGSTTDDSSNINSTDNSRKNSLNSNQNTSDEDDGDLKNKLEKRADAPAETDKAKKKEMWIDGVIYDVTGFVKKHPGGKIIEFVVDTDATEHYKNFHLRSSRAHKILKSLPQRKLEKNDKIFSKKPDGGSEIVIGGEDSKKVHIPDKLPDCSKNLSEKDENNEKVFTKVGDDNDDALTKDLRELTADLIRDGWFKPDLVHAFFRCVEIFVMYAVGMAMMYYSATGYHKLIEMGVPVPVPIENGIWLTGLLSSGNLFSAQQGALLLLRGLVGFSGLFVLGIAQGRCGWLQHECGHYSFTGYIPLDRRLQEFMYGYGTGMSGAWWRNQHNKHHAAPQKVGRDVDLDTLPLVAFAIATIKSTKYGKWLVQGGKSEQKAGKIAQSRSFARTFLQNQKTLFTPIVCPLVAFFWQLYLHPRHSLRTGNYIELFWIGLRYISCYWFLCSDAALSLPGYQAFWVYIVFVSISAQYIFTNFAVSHTHLPTVDNDKHVTWAAYSYAHTMNCTSHWFTNWWMAYLNFQIEHHLWPSMPQYRFVKLSPRVKALFEKHQKPYQVMDYWKAISITMKNLESVAEEALEMTMI